MSDPSGLAPVSDAELAAWDAANQGVIGAVRDWADDHAYFIAGAAVVAGVALMFTGVGGPVGAVLIGAASGALISGGISTAVSKATSKTGRVDGG